MGTCRRNEVNISQPLAIAALQNLEDEKHVCIVDLTRLANLSLEMVDKMLVDLLPPPVVGGCAATVSPNILNDQWKSFLCATIPQDTD